MPRPRTYSYEQLADRIEQVLGERPSLSSLRAAAAAATRTGSPAARPRVTYGMPRPEPPARPTAPAVFDAAKIEEWLARHPRCAWAAAEQSFRLALRDPVVDAADAVGSARRAGLSWAHIRLGLRAERGDTRSRAGIFKAYRYLDTDRDPADGHHD